MANKPRKFELGNCYGRIYLTSLTKLLVSWSREVSLGFTTWSHLLPLGLTWFHLASLGSKWLHLDSLGFAWLHVVSLGVT